MPLRNAKPSNVKVRRARKGVPTYELGDPEYEFVTHTANPLHRNRLPDCVVQPLTTVDVQYIVKQAKKKDIASTIKIGGHSYPGSSASDQGYIKLDLTNMNQPLVDGKHDGYVINGGRCPTVGVSGYILGGGICPFTRSFGMGCDTLLEATIVTADEIVHTVTRDDDPESSEGKLFWALCGAGQGSFGVVLELKMAVSKLKNKEGKVIAVRSTWFPKESDDVPAIKSAFYSAKWSTQMTIDTIWLCNTRDEAKIGVRFSAYYDGNGEDYLKEINQNIYNTSLKELFGERIVDRTSSDWLGNILPITWDEEAKRSKYVNQTFSIFGSFAFENRPSYGEKYKNGDGSSVEVSFIHPGTTAAKKPSTATAFPWRDVMQNLCRSIRAKLRPFSIFAEAAFVNFPNEATPKTAHESAYYGTNREKLREVKKMWDKNNFFGWDQGVGLPQPDLSIAAYIFKLKREIFVLFN
ncbi:FAD-binding domain-containing protein [Mollisia scopiformis]|uniref:FAD-binding domain-containing protein n=1 Tax=Mollisia scopiformis TaxID=149040 RepID=A0A132BBF1_MOLSC|nr:FAD-binding domain-containing protein [Mollisia scopiformis]KUJ08977.1 FAD-binding domain-containing protein [Mollisia scopiformis]